MSGQPGGGCDDPRSEHIHWCAFCGAVLMFDRNACELLALIPPCPRCREKQWRGEFE